jgi:hypothetical protein
MRSLGYIHDKSEKFTIIYLKNQKYCVEASMLSPQVSYSDIIRLKIYTDASVVSL